MTYCWFCSLTANTRPMGNKVELFLFICGSLTMASLIAALLTDCWQINSKGSVMLSTRCKGLWRECVWDRFVKIWTCDDFSSYLNSHPAAIVLTRALLISSCIISVAAFILLVTGFKNVICFQDATNKLRCLHLSCGLYILIGMSSSAAIIKYCVYVYYTHQYEVSLKIPGFPSFEYGYSLWMAVVGNLGAITTAIIICYRNICYKKPNTILHMENDGSGYFQALDVVKSYV